MLKNKVSVGIEKLHKQLKSYTEHNCKRKSIFLFAVTVQQAVEPRTDTAFTSPVQKSYHPLYFSGCSRVPAQS